MQHHQRFVFPCLGHVMQPEALGHEEVELNGSALPITVPVIDFFGGGSTSPSGLTWVPASPDILSFDLEDAQRHQAGPSFAFTDLDAKGLIGAYCAQRSLAC